MGISAHVQNYSGRGMYGKYTHAVYLSDAGDRFRAEEKIPVLADTRKDSLGLGVVYY